MAEQQQENEAAQIETNSAAVFFMACISTRQMVPHAISAPQHYLHLGFIRAILTRVPHD